MAQKNIGIVFLLGYLAAFWALVVALLVYVTGNQAPGAPTLKWADEEIRTTTKLAVEIATEAPDADGDKVSYTYTWTRNGEPVDNKSRSVSNRETMLGEVWEVTVVPDDGTRGGWGCSLPWRACAGDVEVKLSAEIGNTPPRARIRFQDAEGNDVETYDRKTDVTVDLGCFDPDAIDATRAAKAAAAASGEPEPEPEPLAEGEEPPEKEDPCTYTVAWYPGDLEEITEETEPTSTELTMPGSELRKAESWKVIAIANDGTDDGEAVEAMITQAE